MTPRVDLHIHTTASDGQLSPTEVVRKALERGLAVIAITDHDTIEGVQEALEAARGTGLEVIPGVEISTDVPRTEIHMLGYYVVAENPVLCERLAVMRDSRLHRAHKMVDRLTALGLPLAWERVREIAQGDSVGRPHVARAMLEKGYVASLSEAFDRYIGRNGPAYVERFKLSPAEATQMVLAAHGLPVLAHPLGVHQWVPELTKSGLVGLEAYYTGYAPEESAFLSELAARNGLLVTGGSDFHGEEGWPKNVLGGVETPDGIMDALRSEHAKRQALA